MTRPDPSNAASARVILRIAAGLPHPQEAHAEVMTIFGAEAPEHIAAVRTLVARLCESFGRAPALVWGDLIEATGKRDVSVLLVVLAALHEAQEAGEVSR